MHGAPLLVVLGVLPLAWWRRSPALLFCALAVLFVVTAFAVGWIDTKALISLLFMMGAAAVVSGAAAPDTAFPAAEGPLRSVGLLAALGCSYALSFRGMAGVLGQVNFTKPGLLIYFGVAGAALLGALIGAGVVYARGGLAQIDTYHRWQLGLLFVGLAIVLGGTFSHSKLDGWVIALPFNAIVLGLAALLILEGSARLQPWRVGLGCLAFALVTVSRYADLFSSLLARSAVFIALGAGLFLVGSFYARQRRRMQELRP
jgi:hypothetical protein